MKRYLIIILLMIGCTDSAKITQPEQTNISLTLVTERFQGSVLLDTKKYDWYGRIENGKVIEGSILPASLSQTSMTLTADMVQKSAMIFGLVPPTNGIALVSAAAYYIPASTDTITWYDYNVKYQQISTTKAGSGLLGTRKLYRNGVLRETQVYSWVPDGTRLKLGSIMTSSYFGDKMIRMQWSMSGGRITTFTQENFIDRCKRWFGELGPQELQAQYINPCLQSIKSFGTSLIGYWIAAEKYLVIAAIPVYGQTLAGLALFGTAISMIWDAYAVAVNCGEGRWRSGQQRK